MSIYIWKPLLDHKQEYADDNSLLSCNKSPMEEIKELITFGL